MVFIEHANVVGGQGDLGVAADMALPATLDALLDATDREYGRLDILVNNAGINIGFRPLSELSVEDFDAMYQSTRDH